MASESDTAESLIVQERDEKDFDRRNKPYNIDTAIHAKENAGYEIELHIEGTKGDEQIEPNLKVAEGNTGECFLCPPSVEKVVYEDIFRQSEDCPEGISDDTNNQQVIKKIATAEEAEQRPIESPGLDAKDKENTTCDPEKCLEKILPSNPPASPEKFQENVSEADDLEYTSTEVVQGPDVMEETENKRSKKDGDEKTTSSEAEDSNKPQTSSSPTEGNQESMSDIIKHVEELDTSTGESNDTVEEKKDLYEAGIDCNLQEASESISEKDVHDMTGLCETLKSKSELEDNNGNITKFQQKDMDKGKGENSDEEAFSSNTEFGIIMKGPPQTTTINPEECTVKNMMMQERKTKDIQGEIFTLTSENTEAVEPIEEISFSVLGSSRSWTANSKDRKDYIDKLGVRYVSADIKKNITTERENNISQKQDDLCLGHNTIAKVETNGKQNLGFELQPEELEKQVIEDSSQEKFYNEQASEVSKNIEFTSSERTVDEEIERKGIGDATNITKEEGVPEFLESEAEERHAIKIQEELTESETKDMAFDSNLQESSIATSTNTNSSLVESMGKFSAKGEQLSERSIDNGTAEESSNMKQDVESKNEANDTTATSYSANLSFETMDLSEKEEAEMEVYILSQEHEYSIGKEDIGSAEEGVELNETIEKPDSCTYADSAYEEDVTSEETRISESGEISMDTKQYGISTEYLLQKVYNEEQTHCNVKIGIVEAEDSKGMLEEAHELAKEQYFEEPQSIAKGTVQEDSLIAMMKKKADDKESEIKNLYPPRHHDDSSMQEPELGALEKSGSYENQEAEELEYTRFEESDTEKTEGNHENIENSQSQNAPINTYNNGMQVAEAEDKADTQHENTEDEKLYNSILNASSTQDTNIKSNSIGEQRDAKTQAQTSFIEIQDTGANHEDIVHKGFEESATCIERQEQKILEEPTTVIEVQNHVPSEESVRIFNKDVRVNETKESAMEKQQCCVEGDRTSNIPNGAPSYEDSKVDSIEEKWNTENIVGESDQDINAKSDSIEVLRDEEAYRQINFNEISETRVVDNEKIMNQSSEESNSCCAIQGQESESASVEACTPSPLNEVKEYVPSTNECTNISGEDIKESKEKADAIDKQIEEPDMTIRGLDAHKGREDEIPPKTENFMNISKEGKIQEINAQFDSIEKEKEAEQTCSYETKETKIDNDIVNQSSKANDSCSSGYRDQEIAQVSTPLKVVEIPIASKEIHTECSRTDFQGKGIEIGTSIKEQHCGAEDPEVITNGVSSNKDIKSQSHSFEESEVSRTIEQSCLNVTLEAQAIDNEEIMNQRSEDSDSCIVKRDQEASQTSKRPLVEASHVYKDECLKISSGENHDSGDVREASIDKKTVDPKNIIYGACTDEVREVQSILQNENSINIVEDVDQDKKAESHSMEAQKDENICKQLGSNQIHDTVSQKSEVSIRGEESRPLLKADNLVPRKEESTQISSEILEVKKEANIEKQQCTAEEHNKITNGISAVEVEGVDIEQDEKFVRIINGNQDMYAELESIEIQTGCNENYEANGVNNEENEGQSFAESNPCSGTRDQEIAEATTQLREAQGPFPSIHENTGISGEEIELGEIEKEKVTEDLNETKYVASSYSIGDVEIAPATENSTDMVEDKYQEVKNDKNVNQCSEDTDFLCGKQDEEIADECISLIGAQHLVPRNDECTKISSDIIQLQEVEEASLIKNQQCASDTRDSNEIENRVSSYKVDREEVALDNDIFMNRIRDVRQDTDAEVHKLEEQKDDNTQGHISLNKIHKTEVINDKKTEDRSPFANEFLDGKQDQKISAVSIQIIAAENHGPSIDEYSTVSQEQFHVSFQEEPKIICFETKDPKKTRNSVCLIHIRRGEIVPGNENSIDIVEGIDKDIHPESNTIEAQKHENTHEKTTADEIQEIYEVNNEEIKNTITKKSDLYNDEHDQEIAEATIALGEAENPVPSKDKFTFTRISDDKIQARKVKDAAPIDKQRCYSETKGPDKIDNDVSPYKVGRVAHVPDVVCQVEKELELHGYTHSNEKQCIDDDKIEMDSIEVLKDDKTHDKGIYEKDNVNQDKVGNQSSGENNSCMDKQDQEIVQASIPITEAENLVPIIDRCTNTCEDIQISEVKDEASIGKEQCSTEMEDLDKTTNGVTSYEYVKMTRLVNPEKAMDTVDNASEQPSDRNDNMQNKLQEQQHENQNELAKSDEIAGSNSHEIVPQEDMAEAFDTSTNVDIQQANWQICPPLVEELGTLSAQNNEVSIYGSELKHDSRDVCSGEINAKHSTQKMELDDAEKEVTFPNSLNVHINCQEINNTEVSYNFTEDETKESHQTESCKNLEEIQGTTNPVTELKVEADEKSSEKPAQEICLPEVKQREHKVPGIKDEPKYSMAKQEQATKSQTTGESTAEHKKSSLEFEVNSSIALKSALECEGEPIKDTMPKQEAEKGQTTGDSTAKPESLSSEFEGSSSMSDNKMHTEPMSYSDCSLPAIVTKNKRKDSQKSLESPIVSPPIGSGCGSLSKESTKYHDQTKISQQVSGPYAEELTETYEAHQEMHHQIKRSQTTAGERSLPDFGAHKATRKDDKHDKNTVTEETNASDDSKNFEGEAMIESYQEALSDKATECQVNSMDKVDIASEHPSDINANMQEYLRDKKHENQLDLTETHEIDGSNSQDTLLQADMAEAFHVTTILKIQQANTCQMCPPHIKELNYSSAKDTQSIANGSEFKQDSRGVCSGEINASQSTGKLELDDAESTVTFPNPIILQTASCKNVEKIHGTTKPVTELEVKLNEISSKNPEQETCLPEVEQKEIKVPSFEDYSVKESMAKEELVEKGKRTDESKAELEDSSLEFKDEPIKDSMPEQELAESDETIGCGPSSKVSCKFHDKTKSSQQVSKPRGEELTETNETQEKMHYQLKSSQLIAGEGSLTDFGGHEATRNKDKHDKNTVLPYDPTLEQQNMHKTESLDNEEEAVLEEEWETNTELINPAVDGEAIVSSTGKALTRNLYSEQGCQMEERKDDDHPHVQSIAAEKGLELEGNHNNLSATSELQDPCNNVLMEEASEELVDATVEIGNKRYIQDDSRVELEEQDKTVTCTQKGVSVIDLERKEATLYLPKGPVKESSEEPAADSPRIIRKGESQEHVHQEGAVEPIKTQADSNPLDTSINFPSNIMLESSAQANLMVSDMTAQREQVIIHKEANNERENALIISKFDEEKHDEQEDLDMKVPLISDMELKATHKKPHNILLGVGSKVKNSISKVKKAISCTTSEFASEDAIIKLNKPKNADKA